MMGCDFFQILLDPSTLILGYLEPVILCTYHTYTHAKYPIKCM